MHGNSAVHLAGFDHLLHLFVAFLLVRNGYRGDPLSRQRADIIYIHAA